MTTRLLTFYFGLRSPYAWLAQRLLAEHLPQDARAHIEYAPYWDPRPRTLEALRTANAEFLYRPMSPQRHRYILADLKRTAGRLGYALRWPIDIGQPDWELPHLACMLAADAGAGERLRTRLFDARWQQGIDVCSTTVLEPLLASCGLPPTGELDERDDLRRRAVDTLAQAHRHGVFGLPFFVVGRERFWGVDRLPFALRQAALPWRALSDAWLHEAHDAEVAACSG